MVELSVLKGLQLSATKTGADNDHHKPCEGIEAEHSNIGGALTDVFFRTSVQPAITVSVALKDFVQGICRFRVHGLLYDYARVSHPKIDRGKLIERGASELFRLMFGEAFTSLCLAVESGRTYSNQDSFERHVDLAEFYYSQGMLRESADHWQSALRIDEVVAYTHDAYRMLFDIAHGLHDYELALDAASKWMKIDPKAVEYFGFDIAKIYYHFGRYDEALAILEKALRYERVSHGYDGTAKYDEMIALMSLCYIRLENFYEAAYWVSEVSDFENYDYYDEGRGPRGKSFESPVSGGALASLYFYFHWKAEPSKTNVSTVSLSFGDVDTEDLMYFCLDPLAPVKIREMTEMFRALIEQTHAEFMAAKKSGNTKKMDEHAVTFLSAISLLYDFYDELQKYKKIAAPQMFSLIGDLDWEEPLNGFARMSEMDEVAFHDMCLDFSIYLSDITYERSFKAREEDDWHSRAWNVAYSASKFFPKSPKLKIQYSKALRRSSEKPDDRGLAVTLLEWVKNESGMTGAELGDEFQIEIGLAWREHLEALIHFKRDSEKEIASAYDNAKTYLEEAAKGMPDNPEVWLNLSWLHYTWGKKESDFTDAINFAETVYKKFKGQRVKSTKAVSVSSDVLRSLYDAKVNPSARQLGEISRVYGWALTKQAKKEIDYSKYDSTVERYLLPTKEISEIAKMNAVSRREKRDAFYLQSYSGYLLCKAYNENHFSKNAPVPSALSSAVSMPSENQDAQKSCSEALGIVTASMYDAELEHDQSEMFYAMGLIQSERFEFGNLRRTFRNPLFHTAIEMDSYYGELMDFVGMLYPEVEPVGIKRDGSSGLSHDEQIKQVESGQIRGFGAIENLLMAFKKGKGENRKKGITRKFLINALSYQLCVSETELSDKYANLFLVIKLQCDNVKEKNDPAEVVKLGEYFEAAYGWGLYGINPQAMQYLIGQAQELENPALDAVLCKFSGCQPN